MPGKERARTTRQKKKKEEYVAFRRKAKRGCVKSSWQNAGRIHYLNPSHARFRLSRARLITSAQHIVIK